MTDTRHPAIGNPWLRVGFGDVEVDGTTHDGLVKALGLIELDERGWNSELGRDLLRLAGRALSRVARRAGAPAEDAVAAAWELWRCTDLAGVENLWAYTSVSVARDLSREREAREKLTSVKGLRRLGTADVKIFGIDGQDFPAIEDAEDVHERHEMRSSALTTFRQYLVMAGHPLVEADRTIEFISAAVEESATTAAACDRLSRDHALAENLGFDHGRWRALITLALGTTRGQPGLFALASRGHPLPLAVGYLRRARDRFLYTDSLRDIA